MISNFPLRLNNYEFKEYFYVVKMGDTNMVLGMTWLHDIGIFTLNLREMEMRFEMDGKTHVLKALRDTSCKTISLRKMEHLLRHDMVEWAAGCVLKPTQEEQKKPIYHPDIQELRIKHDKVFSEIPPSRPPDRGIEHIIKFDEGAP